MTDRTLPWKERADRLGIPASTIARATGVSVRSVHAYRIGDRNPSVAWLERVDRMLAEIELAVERGGSAA